MPERHAHLRRARHWIANRGWSGFLEEMLRRFELKLKGEALPGRPGPDTGPHPFDLAYGVDTTGLVWGESLDAKGISPDARYWATGYYGVAPSAFNAALEKLNLDWPRFTFVDIGCGKGRALLLALRFPFNAAVGIELSPSLAEVAQRNLVTFKAEWRHSNGSAQVLTGDATMFELPAGPLLLFLYHPFAAPVMQKFVTHLEHSLAIRPRPLYLLYANPELAPLLERTPFLEKVADEHFAFTPEDSAADRFSSRSEHIVTYRSRVTSRPSTPPTC